MIQVQKKHQKMMLKILYKIGSIDQRKGLMVKKAKMIEYFSTPGLFYDLENIEQLREEDVVMDRVKNAKQIVKKTVRDVSDTISMSNSKSSLKKLGRDKKFKPGINSETEIKE